MRTILYKCEDYTHNSVCAEAVNEKDSKKLSGCIRVAIKNYSEEYSVFIRPEDAVHFAETIKALANETINKKVAI